MTKTSLAAANDTEVARPLKVLVPLIQHELAEGAAAGFAHYRKAGELLLEAKEQVGAGEWGRWLKRNFKDATGEPLSARTAFRWMQAANLPKVPRGGTTVSTLSGATEPHRDPDHTAQWHQTVRASMNTLNIERLAQDRADREKETRLQRELGLRLIDIGYKVLATKMHPDRGGSADGMARLNRVRATLRGAL